MGKGYTPFKMKGSPMQRNFGIGSPVKKTGIFDADTLERISREEADKREATGKSFIETGEDIGVSKSVEERAKKGDESSRQAVIEAQKRKKASVKAQKKAGTYATDLERQRRIDEGYELTDKEKEQDKAMILKARKVYDKKSEASRVEREDKKLKK